MRTSRRGSLHIFTIFFQPGIEMSYRLPESRSFLMSRRRRQPVEIDRLDDHPAQMSTAAFMTLRPAANPALIRPGAAQ
jgi:hypothetical protein